MRSRARLISTELVARDTWWMEFDAPEIASVSKPGQFVMLGVGLEATGMWLLPRPFSVGWTGPNGEVGILLRIYGEGTRTLAKLASGDSALLLGPLGRPFELDQRPTVAVAGGVGLAPFIFLAADQAATGATIRLLYGERDAAAVFDPGLITRLTGHEPELFTEDGSAGTAGRVTAGLDPQADVLLVGCGPTPMLHALASFAREHGQDLQVSVEEHMACGIGTCQGCVVPGADGRWIKACIEGPVFDVRELDWGTQ